MSIVEIKKTHVVCDICEDKWELTTKQIPVNFIVIRDKHVCVSCRDEINHKTPTLLHWSIK